MTNKSVKAKLTEELRTTIRTEFVQGIESETGERTFYTLEDLIKKYNLASATLYRCAKKDNWKQLREQYNLEYQEKLNEIRSKKLAQKSINWDDAVFESAKELQGQAMYYLKLNKNAMESETKPFPPSQFLAISNAFLISQKLGKIALGEITENINVNTTIKEADAFREAMELLDSVAEQQRQGNDKPIH